MFLTGITLMANPSSPAEVIHFFYIPPVIVLSGGTHCHRQMALTSNWQKQPMSFKW